MCRWTNWSVTGKTSSLVVIGRPTENTTHTEHDEWEKWVISQNKYERSSERRRPEYMWGHAAVLSAKSDDHMCVWKRRRCGRRILAAKAGGRSKLRAHSWRSSQWCKPTLRAARLGPTAPTPLPFASDGSLTAGPLPLAALRSNKTEMFK